MEYIKEKFTAAFANLNIKLECPEIYASFGLPENEKQIKKYDFALFFDKDIPLARFFEHSGVRVFNSSRTIALCDDKELTYSAAACTGIRIPKTVSAPLMYDVSDCDGNEFLSQVERAVGYPVIVKENVGSQGRQVFIAENFGQLRALYGLKKRISHIYQEYIAGEAGTDTRVYIVGGRAVFAVKRHNTTDFRSNVFMGGKMEKIVLTEILAANAEKIAAALGLEYGSVDFIGENADVFLEANSNAYVKTAESLGADLSERFAKYVAEQIYGA